MAQSEHRPLIPAALEQVIDGLDELAIVLGAPARARLPVVRAALIEAMAARGRGDPVGALAAIGRAMDELAALADQLDPAEAGLMRAVAERFRAALLRGDPADAKAKMDVMFTRAGARERKKPG
jgi:hypothetical protein